MGLEPFGNHNGNNNPNRLSGGLAGEELIQDLGGEGLSSLESKVDVYLSKIKELDSSLYQDPQRYQIIDQQVKNFVSIEKLHKSSSHNRHIFFAGIPLSHSLQLLSSLKAQQLGKERAEKLESEVKRLNEEIDELNEEKRVDFYRFERSIQRAVSIGFGVQMLVRIVDGWDKNSKKEFVMTLRNVNYNLLTLRLRKLEAYKAARFVNLIGKPIKARLLKVLNTLKFNATDHPLDNPLNPIKSIKTIKNDLLAASLTRMKFGDSRVLSTIDDGSVDGDVERGLLIRLERLLEEEMKMLT